MKREVLWRKAAIDDLRNHKITCGEWLHIRKEVERVAQLEYLSLDCAVCRVVQTGGDWWRLKITEPHQIRVFFSVETQRIIVQAVLRRTERCYDIIEILCKVRA